mmetsp:Transcript_21318/g.46277  ORF Transcript_21318/g.46277 Transcript_21318/m.46277 type:complete len:332 (-) Transcript_21318:833-1828(-)
MSSREEREHHEEEGGEKKNTSTLAKRPRGGGRKKKKNQSSKQRDRIRFVDGGGRGEYDDGPHDTNFNLDCRRHSVDCSDGNNTSATSSKDSFGEYVGLTPHKYHDKARLASVAKSKFHKGMYCTERRRYSLARSKFRAALKARILLHEDVGHLSIAPIHEMIGMVERKLKMFDKAMLHLEAALEICDGALNKLTNEEPECGREYVRIDKIDVERLPSLAEQDFRQDHDESDVKTKPLSKPHSGDVVGSKSIELVTNIERIKKTIEMVEKDAKKQQVKDKELDEGIVKDTSKDDTNKASNQKRVSTSAADSILKLSALLESTFPDKQERHTT